jgi:four helix bundle protein
MQPYKQLAVWQKAHALAVDVQRLTLSIPRSHNSGLISQLRRASQSIPTNIAEGSGRGSNRDFANFLQIAIGSASETEYLLLFCADAELAERVECDARMADVIQIRRMLIGLLKRVRTSDGPVSVLPKPKAISS